MKVNGQMITCDRCGKTVFLKATGDIERDGGFTRNTVFEKAEGWDIEYRFGDLCPNCAEKLKEIKSEYEQKKEEFLKKVES